ncbi:MAG: hypothetical protein GY754_07135 [bacterium]|nr:hypothetical protein [bacterium]
MEAYKIKTFITEDGTIILPSKLKSIRNRKVEIVLLVEEQPKQEAAKPEKSMNIPSYKCNGKVKDFTRDELYEREW